jgi:hypothetical protein
MLVISSAEHINMPIAFGMGESESIEIYTRFLSVLKANDDVCRYVRFNIGDLFNLNSYSIRYS